MSIIKQDFGELSSNDEKDLDFISLTGWGWNGHTSTSHVLFTNDGKVFGTDDVTPNPLTSGEYIGNVVKLKNTGQYIFRITALKKCKLEIYYPTINSSSTSQRSYSATTTLNAEEYYDCNISSWGVNDYIRSLNIVATEI